MLKNGFVKIQRSITNWRWYKDVNTFHVFMHLLFKANYEPHEFMDMTVQRGQLVTSIQHLADETGISYRSVRTALSHLKTTGEVTVKTNNKYSLITLLSYDEYTANDKHTDIRLTNDRQSTDNQLTINRQQWKKE